MSDELDQLRKTIVIANQISKRIHDVLEQVPAGEYPEDRDEKERSTPKEEPGQSE